MKGNMKRTKSRKRLRIREVKAKSIIIRSNLPATDYVADPYVGCQHACIYCYSEFMKRFTNHHEAWGTFVDVKTNAPDIVKPMKYSRKRILLSSVTDAYQPIEKRYELSRRLLIELVPAQPKMEVLQNHV